MPVSGGATCEFDGYVQGRLPMSKKRRAQDVAIAMSAQVSMLLRESCLVAKGNKLASSHFVARGKIEMGKQ